MRIIAGAGPGNPKYITKEVLEKIETSEKVIAFGRIKETLKDIRADIIAINKVDKAMELFKSEEDILLLVSGDPNFYGITDIIKRNNIEIDRILPGISSVQYLSCKVKVPWHRAIVKSFHGREIELSEEGEIFFFFTDSINNPVKINDYLNREGFKGELYIGYNLSYEDEEILKIKIGDKIEDKDKLSVVLAVLDDIKR